MVSYPDFEIDDLRTILCCVDCSKQFPLRVKERHSCSSNLAYVKDLTVEDTAYKIIPTVDTSLKNAVNVIYYSYYVHLAEKSATKNRMVAWYPKWFSKLYESNLIPSQDKTILATAALRDRSFACILDSLLLMTDESSWKEVVDDLVQSVVKDTKLLSVIDTFSVD